MKNLLKNVAAIVFAYGSALVFGLVVMAMLVLAVAKICFAVPQPEGLPEKVFPIMFAALLTLLLFAIGKIAGDAWAEREYGHAVEARLLLLALPHLGLLGCVIEVLQESDPNNLQALRIQLYLWLASVAITWLGAWSHDASVLTRKGS